MKPVSLLKISSDVETIANCADSAKTLRNDWVCCNVACGLVSRCRRPIAAVPARGMSGDLEMHDSPSMVIKYNHGIKQPKRRGRDDEHVDRDDDCHMVPQKVAPSRGGSLRAPRQLMWFYKTAALPQTYLEIIS